MDGRHPCNAPEPARMVYEILVFIGHCGWCCWQNINWSIGQKNVYHNDQCVDRGGILHSIMLPGFNATHCAGMKAYATDLAVAHGIGRGEFAASIALLRGASVVVAPTIYSWLFGRQMSQGQTPRKAWWSVIVLGAILPEICHQLLTDDDLDVANVESKKKKTEKRL